MSARNLRLDLRLDSETFYKWSKRKKNAIRDLFSFEHLLTKFMKTERHKNNRN